MPLVVIFLLTIRKQFSFHNKVRQSVLELPFKLDQIFVEKDIWLICFLMDVLVFKLEFKVFMKTLQEIQIEVIQFRLSKKHSQLPKIALIKL